jgi:hypothetical protein
MRCEGFFEGNPLADFSLSEAAQSHPYWKDQAIASGDPLAVMDRAFEGAQDSLPGDAETRRAALLSDVRVAVEAKDPAAIAKVGWLYTLQNVGRDQSFQGPAWLIAACDLGYDCSMRNPELGQACADVGTCNAGLTLADTMQRDLGATRFGAIYAASQYIVYKVNTGDWEGLQQYLETKF